jgi:hypothetical protein
VWEEVPYDAHVAPSTVRRTTYALNSVVGGCSAARHISGEGGAGMSFQDRGYETQLAKSAWLLELADHWSERDSEFAKLLRMKARQLQNAAEQGSRPDQG